MSEPAINRNRAHALVRLDDPLDKRDVKTTPTYLGTAAMADAVRSQPDDVTHMLVVTSRSPERSSWAGVVGASIRRPRQAAMW